VRCGAWPRSLVTQPPEHAQQDMSQAQAPATAGLFLPASIYRRQQQTHHSPAAIAAATSSSGALLVR
jgi:hypothetical protein